MNPHSGYQYLYFQRRAYELGTWIQEKLQAVSLENYTDATNIQAKIEKHQAFEADVAAKSNEIGVLDSDMELIRWKRYQNVCKQCLDGLHRLLDLLRSKLAEKGRMLQQAKLNISSYLKHNYF